MKVISYSLFGANDGFEFKAMLRGFYFNYRMNRIIYPEWYTKLYIDTEAGVGDFYRELCKLENKDKLQIKTLSYSPALCEGMLWRMKPIFDNGVTHVLCRDTDALTTYREAQAVHAWIESYYPIHALLDNPAHSGLMGGMIGVTKHITQFYSSFDLLIKGADLSKRGSDQLLLNQRLGNKQILWHKGKCDVYTPLVNTSLPGVDSKLWESNLTCRHIGSAGVIEMETIRFFKRFDNNPKWDAFEKKYPEIFYWV